MLFMLLSFCSYFGILQVKVDVNNKKYEDFNKVGMKRALCWKNLIAQKEINVKVAMFLIKTNAITKFRINYLKNTLN